MWKSACVGIYQLLNWKMHGETLKYVMRTCIKHKWNSLIINCITKRCIENTCETWQVIDYKRPEDDTIVSKHVGVW